MAEAVALALITCTAPSVPVVMSDWVDVFAIESVCSAPSVAVTPAAVVAEAAALVPFEAPIVAVAVAPAVELVSATT
jgi:hypothetical protein